MKTHLSNKNGLSACARHKTFGANRTKDIYIVSPRQFAEAFKNNKNDCCSHCVKIYNERVAKRIER